MEFFKKPDWTNTISLVGLISTYLTLIMLKLSTWGVTKKQKHPGMCKTLGSPSSNKVNLTCEQRGVNQII